MLQQDGLHVIQQASIDVYFVDQVIGHYEADLLVEDSVIVELKAVQTISIQHEAQLLNYLKATRCEVGLLLNFGPRPEVKRKVFDNERKGNLTWTPLKPNPHN